MVVDGYITVDELVLAASNWGQLYNRHMKMGRMNLTLRQWEFHVKLVLLPEYDRRSLGTYAFKRDYLPAAAKALKNYYEAAALEFKALIELQDA